MRSAVTILTEGAAKQSDVVRRASTRQSASASSTRDRTEGRLTPNCRSACVVFRCRSAFVRSRSRPIQPGQIKRSDHASLSDLDQSDLIGQAIGRHRIAVRRDIHLADDIITAGDCPALKFFRSSDQNARWCLAWRTIRCTRSRLLHRRCRMVVNSRRSAIAIPCARRLPG